MKVKLLMATAAVLLAACASVPRDAGFAEVNERISSDTGQTLRWDPSRPVDPPDAMAARVLLEGELTADGAVEIAMTHNRDLQATLEELGIARAELIEASTIRNPILHSEIRFPGEPRNPVEFELTQALVDILQLRTRRAFGRAVFAAAQSRIAGAVINFAAEVRTSYFDLLASQLLMARQQTLTEASRIATELAVRQHSAGNISDLDLENEQALYEQAKLELARAQLAELQARERLIANLGVPGPLQLRLPAEFPALTSDEAMTRNVESEALTRRLDIALAQQELEAARHALPLARAAVLEDTEVDIHHEREPDGKRTTGPGLTVPIPIFNTGRGQRERATATLRRAEQRLHALRLVAQSEARAARESLLEARARAEYIRDVVLPRRQRILALTQLEYNAMLRGVFQLIEARQNVSHAERELILAQRDYWVARTDLQAALSGATRFAIREEPRIPRLDLFSPVDQQQSKEHE